MQEKTCSNCNGEEKKKKRENADGKTLGEKKKKVCDSDLI